MADPFWMLEAPQVKLSAEAVTAFRAALEAKNVERLPAGVPLWLFLDWLAREGYLLHGSARGDLTGFEPRAPFDLSPDDFSKRTGVFAASDGLWALMYALRDRSRVARMLNMALEVQKPGGSWTPMRYFLSFAPRDPAVTDGRSLLSPGCVYVLPPQGFERMPPYDTDSDEIRAVYGFNPTRGRRKEYGFCGMEEHPVPFRVLRN